MRNPAHVPLNYLYAILEAEARIAMLSIGFIPGQACCIPTDLQGRDSLVLAAWSRFLEGRDENGDPTPINDRRATELIAAVQAEHVAPRSFLDYQSVFGDLGTNTRLRETFVACRASLVDRGARATISAIADF